jgi:hypothetical protein
MEPGHPDELLGRRPKQDRIGGTGSVVATVLLTFLANDWQLRISLVIHLDRFDVRNVALRYFYSSIFAGAALIECDRHRFDMAQEFLLEVRYDRP